VNDKRSPQSAAFLFLQIGLKLPFDNGRAPKRGVVVAVRESLAGPWHHLVRRSDLVALGEKRTSGKKLEKAMGPKA
jgi:hypothetical protein